VFREGVELPDYAAGRELPCRVTSDNGQTLTVDVSRYKGVTEHRKSAGTGRPISKNPGTRR
jgi:hypothetical protein